MPTQLGEANLGARCHASPDKGGRPALNTQPIRKGTAGRTEDMQNTMRRFLPAIAAGLVAILGLTGCETAGGSALAGAATGAAIGAISTGRGRGALKGAAIGAGAGYLIGRMAQEERRERASYDEDYDDRDRNEYRSRRSTRSTRYPVGERTAQRGYVVSPYEPNNLVDVRGMPRGARVIDPSANRIFINP